MSSWKEQSQADHAAALAREARIARIERKQQSRRRVKIAFAWITGIVTFSVAAIQFYVYTLAVWTTDNCTQHDFGKEKFGQNCKEIQPTSLLILASIFFAAMACVLVIGMITCLRGLVRIVFGYSGGAELITDGLGLFVAGIAGTLLSTLLALSILL